VKLLHPCLGDVVAELTHQIHRIFHPRGVLAWFCTGAGCLGLNTSGHDKTENDYRNPDRISRLVVHFFLLDGNEMIIVGTYFRNG
jgi:hypothetical protein